MSAPVISVKVVDSKSDLKRFVNLPYKLYKNNPYWVPPLRGMEMKQFSSESNPAYDHCDARLFMALQNGEVVGRIATIINHRENHDLEPKVARFGWLDFIDDKAVSAALFAAAVNWVGSQGIAKIKGPLGFSNMDKAGLLIEGFEELSTMAVIYNHAYYPTHLEELGFEKLVDWKEFESTVPEIMPERVVKFASLIQKRYNLHEYRPANRSDLRKVGYEIFSLLNLAYKDLEGFIPHTEKQIELFINQYLSLLNPDFISIVRDADHLLAGFGITMPSFTKALQKANGSLFPFGFWHLRKAMKSNDRADLYLIAVRPDLQNKGITAMIFRKIIETFINYGIRRAETNPELESNQDVQNLWKDYEMRLHKRRRCYMKDVK
ncbi:MAG: GNAT family N-acetyltransferase [Saprospiraceae bacterium]|nr:GNAT family N-acetyltransferase [Saprospiraceae bacterium]